MVHNGESIFAAEYFVSFAELPPDYADLIDRHATSFDQTLCWYRRFEEFLLAPGESLLLIGLRERHTGTVAGLLPLRRGRVHVTAHVSTDGLSALSNYYSGLYSAVVRPSENRAIVAALADAIIACPKAPVLDLSPVASDDRVALGLVARLQERGWFTYEYEKFANWSVSVSGTSSRAYLQDKPGIERKRKALLKKTGIRIDVTDGTEGLEYLLDKHESVYGRSWQKRESHQAFIRAIARDFAARGWLRIGMVELYSEPIASQIWFVHGPTAYIFKVVYDEQHARLSPGTVLTARMFERVIDMDHVATVDFLSGDDEYKRFWMTNRRVRIGLRAATPLSAAGIMERASRMARRLVRTVRRP